MKNTIIPIFSFFLAVSSTPVKPSRRYSSSDDDISSRRYINVENEDGSIDVQDLTLGLIYEANISDVSYYLYTQQTPDPFIITAGNVSALDGSPFDPDKFNFFIVHGWNSNYESSVNTLITAALLEKHDINVFVVDWSKPANRNYISARTAVGPVGTFIGEFINGMKERFALPVQRFALAGHSLGAHVVGKAGATSPVDHIVGMDPAAPLFLLSSTEERLDASDAPFVQVIHTDGMLLGFASSLGHADYWPNGGLLQPGCGLDLTGSCSHARSYEYFAESLKRGRVFESVMCDSYDDFENDDCDLNEVSYMGGLVIDEKEEGDFYLDTNREEPFGKSTLK